MRRKSPNPCPLGGIMGARNLSGWFAVTALLAALGVYLGRPVPSVGQAVPSPEPESPRPAAHARLVGSVGCSARACHGGIEPADGPVQQNEYTQWLTGQDKHTEA